MNPLPSDTYELMTWEWAQFESLYHALANRELTAANVDAWLTDWAQLGKRFDEAYWRLWIDTTLDTANAEYERRFNDFLERLHLPAKAADQTLKQKLLASGLEPANFAVQLRSMRVEADLFRAENLPLLNTEKVLSAEYDRIKSVQTVQWNGAEVTINEMYPLYFDVDRTTRERAWRLVSQRQAADRDAINNLWGRFMHLRAELAANAGLPDYREYRWRQLLRHDYTPADCVRFHDAVEQVVVPAVAKILRRRQQSLGVDTLRPWDIEVDPYNRPALQPFQTIDELESKGLRLFGQIDAQLADYFQIMQRENYLDLADRKGKMPSAYCAALNVQKRPFVFMSAVTPGTHEDVMTLLHECGHAFHVFENTHLPYHQQLEIGAEFHEVASIAMELLASPYLTEFYDEADYKRARLQQVESMLLFWPYCVVVDAFQHWVYTHHADATDPANCDAQWTALWRRFMPVVDWTGLEDILADGWRTKLHIHQDPFYYLDYGLAQLGAVQIWQRAQLDRPGTIRAYRNALSLGGTASLSDLYAAAGAKFAFDAPTLGDAVNYMETQIAELS